MTVYFGLYLKQTIINANISFRKVETITISVLHIVESGFHGYFANCRWETCFTGKVLSITFLDDNARSKEYLYYNYCYFTAAFFK